jgi:hypothetical protein
MNCVKQLKSFVRIVGIGNLKLKENTRSLAHIVLQMAQIYFIISKI